MKDLEQLRKHLFETARGLSDIWERLRSEVLSFVDASGSDVPLDAFLGTLACVDMAEIVLHTARSFDLFDDFEHAADALIGSASPAFLRMVVDHLRDDDGVRLRLMAMMPLIVEDLGLEAAEAYTLGAKFLRLFSSELRATALESITERRDGMLAKETEDPEKGAGS